MIYSINQLQQDMSDIEAVEFGIRDDRGRRYGDKEDTLANVATFGSDGAIINMWECAMRIKNMFGKPKSIEDLENAVHDIRNYAAYVLILEKRNLTNDKE